MRVEGTGCTVEGSRYRVNSHRYTRERTSERAAGCRVQGSELRVEGAGCTDESRRYRVHS
jgi:hypothetical protein